MSNFLDNTGLSRLVENIKNKFQPKPFLLELSVSYDRQTNEGSVSIRKDDIARAFDHLYKYKDSSDYNISFKVYHSNYDCTYICKANSITFDGDAICTINIDYNLYVADDGDQCIGHIRLDLYRERVEGYYDEQNIVYANSVLLTGTGYAVRPERYYIDFEENFFRKYSDTGGLLSDEYYFDVKENMKILYGVFESFYNGKPITFNINEENISGTINNIIPIVNISEDKYIQASFIIIDPNASGVDTDDLYIRKIAFDIQSNGSYSLYKMTPIEDLSLTNIKESTLFVEQYLTNKGNGTKFLANNGNYVDTSKLITFEAENGSLNAEQVRAIEEGYLRNLPIYVLYSGIKMLVNSIQKLGAIYSLSCRHDNSTYSITMNLDDDSYEISSVRE